MKQQGFTIIELMVVIGIIGVLAVIAIPAYSDYTQKARRSDAKVSLSALAQAQESYHSDYLKYASILGSASNKNGTLGCRTACTYTTEAVSSEGHYVLKIEAGNASSFVISAVPKTGGAQISDTKCPAFTINSLGKKASGADVATAKTNLSQTTVSAQDPNGCW